MKKIILIIAAAAALATSCQKAETNNAMEAPSMEGKEYTFEFDVQCSGFGVSTKADATIGWTAGESVFVFFQPDGGDILGSYLTLTYDGSKFVPNGSIPYGSLAESGKVSAVYVPYLTDGVTPVYSGGKWTIDSGDVYYSCAGNIPYYTINSSTVIIAPIAMSIPEGYVQIAVPATKAAEGDKMSCTHVGAYSGLTLGNNLEFSVSSVSDYKMTGHKDGDKVYFWGKKNDCSDDICNFILSSSIAEIDLALHVASKKIQTNKAYNADFIHFYPSDSDILPGVFSVSPEKKVRFTKGNLYFDGKVFKLEGNQYDYRTYEGKNSCIGGSISETGTPTDNWGLFGWSSSAKDSYSRPELNYGMSISKESLDYGRSDYFKDWGYSIVRTLSKNEWQYLFSFDTSSAYVSPYNGDNDTRRGKNKFGVTVCGNTNCVVLAPDDFTGAIETVYDVASWAEAEAAGLVCLPGAGSRSGAVVNNTGNNGNYWSNTCRQVGQCYAINFSSSYFYLSETPLYLGCSVRLVADSEE